jgi:hypothetical protein
MKENILIIDVETAGTIERPLIYDLGFAIYTKDKELIEKNSLLISEIFDDSKLMNSAYYSKKVPTYKTELQEGRHELVTFKQALQRMGDLIKKYDVKTLSAYNLAFDLRALENTSKVLLNRELKFESYQKLCIMGFACQVVFRQKTYQKVATREGWISEKGNLRTTAEVAYRYLTGQYQFMEEHKGLADVEIEAEILKLCQRQKKKVKKGIIENAWKIPNSIQFKMARAT